MLGLEEEAQAFYGRLKWIQERSSISPRSLQFWTRAVQRPLYIAPDVDEEDENAVQRPSFLREFEEMRQQLRHATRSQQLDSEEKASEKIGEVSDEATSDSRSNRDEKRSKSFVTGISSKQ